MDIHSLQAIVIDALEDIKAQDIKLFDTMPLTSLFDRVAIVSGTSNRQTRALAAHVRDKVKQAGGDVISVEGEETGEWVLVDLGDMVVHVMQPTIRSYYNLEELWGEYPIDFKTTKKPVSRRSASPAKVTAPEDDASTKAPIARKGSVKKPAYEKGESTKSKATKGKATTSIANESNANESKSSSAKPATSVARKAKTELKSAALSGAMTSADFQSVGAPKTTPKTLPWRAAADKPGKIGAKTLAKTGVKSAGSKPSTSKVGAKLPAKAAMPKAPRISTSKLATQSGASKPATKRASSTKKSMA